MSRFDFKLPDVGEGTAEAEIIAWHVAVGQTIEEDAPLVDVMTDKATVEMTSPVAGRVLEIIGEPGDMAAVGAVLASFEVKTEGAAPVASRAEPEAPSRVEADVPQTTTPSIEAPVQAEATPAAVRRGSVDKPLAAPAVRRRAETLGIDLSSVHGGGPGGRIEHGDLDAHLARLGPGAQPTPPPPPRPTAVRTGVETVKIVGLRRRISEKMQEAKRHIPHFTYVEEVDMTALEELRAHLNSRRLDRPRLSVLPFLLQALVNVLPNYPQVNAQFDDDGGVVHRHAAVHVGVATQTADGLMAPVVRHAESLDLWQTAAEIARLAQAARSGKAKSEELRGSTITVTSLGALGGIATTPVINYPEVAILGPNKIVERPVVRQGQIVVRKMMNLSSSFDHRVVDGYDAAAFIQEIKAALENPATLFIP